MIESAMLIALGFLLALLLALLLVPAFSRRTVRLTTQRIEATLPMSVSDIQAGKDQLRAEFAIRLRRVEMALEKTREQAARHLVERNKNQVIIARLEEEQRHLGAALSERSNASTVLEQTVKRRIPELETQIARERDVIAMRDRELARMGRAYDNQTEALALVKQTLSRRDGELENLRASIKENRLPAKAKRGKKTETAEGDTEADVLRAQNRELEVQLSRLRQELGDLRQQETAETALLRSELQRLADLLMSAPPEISAAAANRTADKPSARDAADDGNSTKAGPAKPARRRKRLRDRLKGLTAKEKAEA